MSEIAPRVRAVIARRLMTDVARVTDHAHILMDLHADSLDRVEIALALEEGFGIRLRDDDIETAQTVGDVLRIVTAALAAQPRKRAS